MRALFITTHLRVGGAQRAWSILLPGLSERGIQTRLVTLEDEGEFFRDLQRGGTEVSCLRRHEVADPLTVIELLRSAPMTPDVVVTHDERSHVVGRAVASRRGLPHVCSDHGGPGFRLKLHRHLILRLLAPGFAGTVTMSHRRVPDLVQCGFDRHRIRVIQNGVDPDALRPSRARHAVRAELGVGDDAFVALLPVVLRPEKRPDRFVRAVSRAHAQEPCVRGLVAGYGPGEQAARRLAAHSGGAVRILGHRQDIADLMAACDVVCLTSDVEGVPFVVLEAMALGKPVLAMRAGALEEVVVHRETGLLVPAGDEDALAHGLLSLARSPAWAHVLGSAGADRQRARFDEGRMCDEHAELLHHLCATRSKTLAHSGTATSSE